MKFKHKIAVGLAFLVFASLLVISAETETVFNWDTNKLDFIRTGNFSGTNVDLDGQNLTTVDCIIFDSGGEICSGS